MSELALPAVRPRAAWIFSPRTDLLVFGGSALLSLIALAAGARLGILHSDAPEWAWIAGVLLVDVAHVWSTLFRTYFDSGELRKRPLLYVVVPVAAYVGAWIAYDYGAAFFWRCLAYVAVFHFVRQQYGWVALYRSRAGETSGRWLDTATIYAATLYPLLWWHAHLPRRFAWFVPHDFAALPRELLTIATPLYWLLLAAYAIRSIARGIPNPGKDLVVVTTALLWHLGIITLDSDYAFTVTNVFIHGIPYLALVYSYQRANGGARSVGSRLLRFGPLLFLAAVWLLAFGEEALWDMTLWHERAWLTGGIAFDALDGWLVPLLAVPQLAHYLLDGFIWKRKTAAPLFAATDPATSR